MGNQNTGDCKTLYAEGEKSEFYCEICEINCADKKALTLHNYKRHKMECKVKDCTFLAMNYTQFIQHMANVHSQGDDIEKIIEDNNMKNIRFSKIDTRTRLDDWAK